MEALVDLCIVPVSLTSCSFLIPSVRHMINGEPDGNHDY